jgi:hypothetical protein
MEEALEEFPNWKNGSRDKIIELVNGRDYKLVIVDTLARGIQDDYNDNNAMTEALKPLHVLAHDLNVAFLFVDHHRKLKRDNPDAIIDILGGIAKSAVIDTIWGLYVDRRGSGLQILGRDVSSEELALEFDENRCFWRTTGVASLKPLSSAKEEIISFISENGPQITSELAIGLGRDKGNLNKDLKDLVIEGRLVRRTVGTAFQYDLPENTTTTLHHDSSIV